MKKRRAVAGGLLCLAGLLAGGRCTTAALTAATLPLEEAIKLPDQTLDFQKSVDLALPALPAKPGKILVLRFKMVSYCPVMGGYTANAAIQVNGAPIGQYTSGSEERLIGRSAMFEFANYPPAPGLFAVFSGPNLATIYAPDVRTGDAATQDGLGATFALNISDVARGVDVNTLTIRNIRASAEGVTRYDLIVRGIEVGWADKGMLPKSPDAAPTRGTIAAAVSAGSIRLAQGVGGGFTVARAGGAELAVETTLGMSPSARSELVADDSPVENGVAVTREAFGPAGFRMTAVWAKVKLVRTVEIKGGLVEWKERWTNTGSAILGIPFRHRMFLRNAEARFVLAGHPTTDSIPCSGMNPTLYVDSRDHPGCGWGVVMESDWLRLLGGLRCGRGMGEIYSDVMALAPQSSCDFLLTLTPVDSGGYWTFINGVRRRWGCNRTGQSAPWFFAYAPVTTEGSPEANIRKALGNLGPVIVSGDAWNVRDLGDGQYPKLAPDAPRAPGGCPDFDVEKWLTEPDGSPRVNMAFTEAYWKQFADECALIHKVCPGVRVISGASDPSWNYVYKALAGRWPYAADVILTAEGAPFQDAGYSRAYCGDWVNKGWAIYYYVPRPSSAYLDYLLKNVRRTLDDCGADGMFWDEFCWVGENRGYSRYDYSRWDGHSADLNARGNVVRLKCDNAWITETAQLLIIQACLLRGKFFVGNGAAALRSVNSLPAAHSVEGGNGYEWMANNHLSPVPVIWGNFGGRTIGDLKTRKDIFGYAKSCLSIGCIYSPYSNDNLLLEGEGPDNFVCKLYPITIRDLGAGTVTGEERLITTQSGAFDWPKRDASVRLYVYDEKGDLTGKETVLKAEAGKPLALTVPKDGMVIAEIMP